MLSGCKGAALHHGDCVGADAQAHEVACSLGRDVTIHPPVNGAHRAWKASHDIRTPRPYLSRCKDIVRETDMLIAAPVEDQGADDAPVRGQRSGSRASWQSRCSSFRRMEW